MTVGEKVHGLGYATEVAQERSNENIRQNVPSWVRNGVLIKDVTVEAGNTVRVAHGLKRALQGFLILNPRVRDAPDAFDVGSLYADDKIIVLNHPGSGPLKFDLWVW